MKIRLTFLVMFLLGLSATSQTVNTNYNPELAKSFGADHYGMKNYVLVILKTGSNTNTDKETTQKLFAGHMSNIKRLVDLEKLVVAGPLAKNDKTYRGIFILNVPSIDEAIELLQTDPAVKENLLEAELYQWYGAAALPEYIETQKKITKLEF